MVRKIPQTVKAIPINNKKPVQKEKVKKMSKILPQKSYIHMPSLIGCRARKLQILQNVKYDKKRLKKKERVKRQQENKRNKTEPLAPITIEDKREIDENFIFSEDSELINEEKFDEFADYYDEKITPKIFITTNNRPKKELFDFLKEIKEIFPNSFYYPRRNYSLQEICKFAPAKNYTHLMVFRETRRKVDELILSYLPKGPTAIFKVTSTKLNQEIFHHGNTTDHFPELILNNFNSKVGRRVGRLFASLLPQQPEFKGRRVVTFHNQRDFIFFRHHRYIFKEEGEKVGLQEIGPQMTLKLKKFQLGTFDNVFGEVEFQARDDMWASYQDKINFFITFKQ